MAHPQQSLHGSVVVQASNQKRHVIDHKGIADVLHKSGQWFRRMTAYVVVLLQKTVPQGPFDHLHTGFLIFTSKNNAIVSALDADHHVLQGIALGEVKIV